ncbi:SDR family oxidoreductase [Rhodoferax sp. BLA1]|uniref:UDP-glucose 4-epimerase family protein n=1 Tax=Rhodoferax sp. BLA1 TaxID=2576062 RepID=UPI0015D3543E|nr:SDR family oxidoreductase [Rhodoferax sp. BLA1]
MKCLVTGASGFVGRSLVGELLQRGCEVRAETRSVNLMHEDIEQVNVGSIDDSTQWFGAVRELDVVIHLAARVHVMQDIAPDPLAEFRKTNTLGSLALAQQAAAAGVKRFVFLSSIKVNGESTLTGAPFTEENQPNPHDSYGVSKLAAEQGLQSLSLETGMEVIIIRSPLVYGPGVKANFASLMRAVQKGLPLPLGAIHNQRSLVALDNLTDFIITCIAHPKAANQTFLISDGQDLSTTELVQGMAQAAGVSARLLPVPVWALEWAGRLVGKADAIQRLCGNLQIDSSKARDLLGWVPKISVQEGLRRAMNGNVKK